MRAHKADKNSPLCETYYNNEAIVVPFNVKNIPVIANIVHRVEHFSDVAQVLPVGLTCNNVPILQRLFRLWVLRSGAGSA